MALTSGRTLRPSCVLLDADVIIAAHELGIWRWLVQSYRVFVPSVVVREARYYYDKAGHKVRIDLPGLVAANDIVELAATVEEIVAVRARFDEGFLQTIHAGETEALALVLSRKIGDGRVCSGDAHAIQALAMLGYGDSCVSFESLLGSKKLMKALDRNFWESTLRYNLTLGSLNRISSDGLSGSPYV